MSAKEFLNAMGELDIEFVEKAIDYPGKKQRYNLTTLLSKPVAAAIIAFTIVSGVCFSAYAGEMNQRYNAAVGYLHSLGIEAEDLSDYSRAEVREIAKYFQIEEPAMSEKYDKYADLREKINKPVPARPTEPTSVTSEQIRTLTPTMTLKEVTAVLGETVDIGSGFCILLYEVDGEYTLNIPFAGLDAQLGVTGDTLLQALQPKENK